MKNSQLDNAASTELMNGQFIDVINGSFLDPQVSVIIQGGKIISMPGLSGESCTIKADFSIDLKGKTVLPGLFNTHSHIQMVTPALLMGTRDLMLINKHKEAQIEKNMADCLTRGITNIRDALSEDLSLNRNLKQKITNGDILGPRILQSINLSPLGGTFAPKHNLMSRVFYSMMGYPPIDYGDKDSGVIVFDPAASGSEVRDAVDRAIDERDANFIKIYDQLEKKLSYKPGAKIMTMDQLGAAVDHAHGRGVPTTMHHTTVDSFRRGLKAGVTSLAHFPFDGPLTQQDILDFQNGTCILEPTFSVAYCYNWDFPKNPWSGHPRLKKLMTFRNETYPYTSLAEAYWLPELRRTMVNGMEKANRGNMKMFGLFDMSNIYLYFSGMVTHGMDNIQKLVNGGGLSRMACGNDAGASNCTQADIRSELIMMDFCLNEETEEKRFTGIDALRMATINSARAMGLEDSFGSIEVGKTADLVVLSGDPRKDYRMIGCPADAVFMDGKLVVNHCHLNIEVSKG